MEELNKLCSNGFEVDAFSEGRHPMLRLVKTIPLSEVQKLETTLYYKECYRESLTISYYIPHLKVKLYKKLPDTADSWVGNAYGTEISFDKYRYSEDTWDGLVELTKEVTNELIFELVMKEWLDISETISTLSFNGFELDLPYYAANKEYKLIQQLPICKDEYVIIELQYAPEHEKARETGFFIPVMWVKDYIWHKGERGLFYTGRSKQKSFDEYKVQENDLSGLVRVAKKITKKLIREYSFLASRK